MNRFTLPALLCVAAVTLLGVSQAQASGYYKYCEPQYESKLPDCYWTVDFKVAYKSSYKSYSYYYGSLAYDASKLKGYGTEKLAIDGSSSIGSKDGLLFLTLDFKGKTFTHKSDVDYDKYPIIKFVNGVFKGVDFQFKSGNDKFHIDYDDFDKNGKGKGYVKYSDPSYSCEAIPTPAAATAGLALMGLMGLRRRNAA